MGDHGRAAANTGSWHMPQYRWVVLAIIFLSYMMCFADRGNIGVVLPALKAEFSMTNMEAGALMSFFYIGYSVTQIPAGFFASRFGTRGLVCGSVLGFSLFTYLISTASSAAMIKWSRIGLGCCEGPFPVGASSTIKNWFPPRERGTATGIYMAATTIATMLTPPAAAWILTGWGWRYVFIVFAVPGFVTATLWYFLVRTRPEESGFVGAAELAHIRDATADASTPIQDKHFRLLDRLIRARHVAALDTNRKLLTSWNLWGITLSYFFAVSIVIGILTWVPSYLVHVKGLSFREMGWLAAAPWIGGTFGALFGGWFSDRVLGKRRKPTMWVTALATAAMMFVLIALPDSLPLLTAALFMSGFLLHIGWPAFTAYPMGLTTSRTYPVAISILNTGGNMGGFFAPIIAGYLLDLNGTYDLVFLYFAACGVLCWLLNCTIEEPI
jgi:sugar phosphate permease